MITRDFLIIIWIYGETFLLLHWQEVSFAQSQSDISLFKLLSWSRWWPVDTVELTGGAKTWISQRTPMRSSPLTPPSLPHPRASSSASVELYASLEPPAATVPTLFLRIITLFIETQFPTQLEHTMWCAMHCASNASCSLFSAELCTSNSQSIYWFFFSE